jgi:hypothetical protein
MTINAIIMGDGPCPGTQPLQAVVRVSIIESGENEGCAEVIVENSPSPLSTGFVGSLCLNVNNPGDEGDFELVSGPGAPDTLSSGNCPGGCLPRATIVHSFTSQSERINPGESATFIICSPTPFTEEQFQSVALHFQGIQGCPVGNNSICLSAMFVPVTTTTTTSSTTSTTSTTTTSTTTTSSTSTTSTTTVCPIPNPQTCCQVAVEFNTQLVPPALASSVTTEVFFTQPPVIEDVCPEKVIVCGAVAKKITYTAVDEQGNQCPMTMICDERPFQCIIDREDANEGERDLFKVCGFAILCEGAPRLLNRGTRPGPNAESDPVEVFWRVKEKDIVKVCIRKFDCNGCEPNIPPCQ